MAGATPRPLGHFIRMHHAKSLLAITLALVISRIAADTPQPTKPQHIAVVTCFNGKLDSGSFCRSTPTQEPETDPKIQVTYGMTCGSAGKVSELHWQFIRQEGEADIYRFTRRFSSDAPNAKMTTHTVSFFGKRIIVFEDEYQVIVMEGPKETKK